MSWLLMQTRFLALVLLIVLSCLLGLEARKIINLLVKTRPRKQQIIPIGHLQSGRTSRATNFHSLPQHAVETRTAAVLQCGCCRRERASERAVGQAFLCLKGVLIPRFQACMQNPSLSLSLSIRHSISFFVWRSVKRPQQDSFLRLVACAHAADRVSRQKQDASLTDRIAKWLGVSGCFSLCLGLQIVFSLSNQSTPMSAPCTLKNQQKGYRILYFLVQLSILALLIVWPDGFSMLSMRRRCLGQKKRKCATTGQPT
jgi:hypothetical protein